jgi:hypothetical protein
MNYVHIGSRIKVATSFMKNKENIAFMLLIHSKFRYDSLIAQAQRQCSQWMSKRLSFEVTVAQNLVQCIQSDPPFLELMQKTNYLLCYPSKIECLTCPELELRDVLRNPT